MEQQVLKGKGIGFEQNTEPLRVTTMREGEKKQTQWARAGAKEGPAVYTTTLSATRRLALSGANLVCPIMSRNNV